MKKIKVALIGYGHLGKWHAQKIELQEQAELYAIIEVNTSQHESIQKLYPQTIITNSLSEVMANIDAGVVVTPTSYHSKLVCELLAHKKHVFCEKPLCSNKEEVLDIKSLFDKAGDVALQVGHSERFHKIWETFREYCQSSQNAIIQINRISPFKGRATDVDVTADLMIHDIDLLYYLFSDQVEIISSTGIKSLGVHFDHVSTLFKLESGNKAWVNASRNSCSEERSLRVSDRRGELFIDLMNNKFERRDQTGALVEEGTYEKRDHLLLEHQAFYHAIINNKKPVIDLSDGIRAVNIVSDILAQS